MRRACAAVLLVVVLAAAQAPAASAAPAPPQDVEVKSGERWQADRDFELRWLNPGHATPAIAAVHYLVRDGAGAVVFGPKRLDTPAQSGEVTVPHTPGTYSFEVWLEDTAGGEGEPAGAELRFDDSSPATVEPQVRAGWIGRDALPYPIRISHPGPALPMAGIRGYAIAVDRNPEGEPCAARTSCTDAETDLRGGVGDDTLAIGDLPEGLSWVHATAVSGSGVRAAVAGSAAIQVDRVDPVTQLSGIPDGWTDRPVTLRATAADGASGMRPAGPAGPFTAIRVDNRPPASAQGASTSTTVIEAGVHVVAFYARDAAGNTDDGSTANGQRNAGPTIAKLRIDRQPPAVAFLPSLHPDDPELIEARVSDSLSGPDPDGGWIGVRASGSGKSFAPLPTSVDGDRLRTRWDSDEFAPGRYEFQATGYDRAGNAMTSSRHANGSPMELPSPLKTQVRLSGGLAGVAAGATGKEIRFGGETVYRGRLSLPSGAPISHMPVRVVERFEASAGTPDRATDTVTTPDGQFSVRLAPGPSREVRAIFAGTRNRTRAAGEATQLTVRSGVSLRASARAATVGGRPVVFRGKVAGGEIPALGLAIQLQFRLPGAPWSEFRTVQTDRTGRFRYPYRFSDDDSRGVRFLFRAYVPEQSVWPYAAGGSLPVGVSGR